MTTYPIVVSKENGTKPSSVVMRSENSLADMKCVLLERALTIKEDKIKSLEERIKNLQIKLEQTERKVVMGQERSTNKVVIVNKNNNNNVSYIYCMSATVVLFVGLIKIIKS